MRRVGVPVNPDGIKPVAKLNVKEIVLFENSTIAELKRPDVLNAGEYLIEKSPYQFLYTNIGEIQDPELKINTVISPIMKRIYYFYNILMLIVFTGDIYWWGLDGVLGSMYVAFYVMAIGGIEGIYYFIIGRNNYSKLIIQKFSRADKYVIEGKTWKDYLGIFFWSKIWIYLAIVYFHEGDISGLWLSLVMILAPLVLNYILVPSIIAIKSYISKNTVIVNLLSIEEFHEELCNLRNTELEKNPEKTELRDLIKMPEGQRLEFKSSVWASYHRATGELQENPKKSLIAEDSVVKTIAGFLNVEGGTLVIGVQDKPERKVVGVEPDFKYSGRSMDVESFQNSLSDIIRNATSCETIVGTFVFITIEEINDNLLCVVEVKQRQPGDWTWVGIKSAKWKGGASADEVFYVRSGPSTKRITSKSSAHEWRESSPDKRVSKDNWFD